MNITLPLVLPWWASSIAELNANWNIKEVFPLQKKQRHKAIRERNKEREIYIWKVELRIPGRRAREKHNRVGLAVLLEVHLPH